MKNYFEGTYYKHQKDDHTLCLIVGRSESEEFIQVITEDSSYNVPLIGHNKFSKSGIQLDIRTNDLTLHGKLSYGKLSPIKYGIMGPFQHFPMECSHTIISMYHKLQGQVVLNGTTIDFTGGTGYMEGDSGTSFPKSYLWAQSNDFPEKCSVTASVAHIPFYGLRFKGCICIVQYQGKEYRLATYLGVRVLCCTKSRIILKQGLYRLDIKIKPSQGHLLNAPHNGEMTRTIIETAACPAVFRFFRGRQKIFDFYSEHTSYEYESASDASSFVASPTVDS